MSNNREILDFAVRNIDIIAYEEKKMLIKNQNLIDFYQEQFF